MHAPGCEGIQTDREWAAWAIRWPNHCGTCMGSGIGSYSGGGEYEPPDMEPCEECILPHSDERSKCPRCAYLFPEDDMEVNKCAHCGWNAVEDYPDSAPYGGEHGCSCQWAYEGEIMDQIGQELADILYREAPFDSEGVVFDSPYVIGMTPYDGHERLYQGGREGDEDSGYWPISHREALVYALMGSDTERGMRDDGVPQIRVALPTEQMRHLRKDPETSWVGIAHNPPIPYEIQSREELAQDIEVFLWELKNAHWTDPDDDEEGWNESQSEIAPFLDTGARDASNKQRIAHIEKMLDRVRGDDFGRSQRHYMNDAESISDDELRKQGKILEQDSGSQYSPCACGCRILVRRPCLRCGSDQHSHKDRFSCAAMSDGSRRYRGQPQCFRCKAYGHTQKICPLPAPVFPPRTCAYCGEGGHNARWCPTIPDDFEWPTPEYLEWDAEMIHHPEHDAFIEELNKVFSNYVPTSDGFIDYHNFTSSDGSVEIVIVESNDWWLQRDLEENEPPDTYMILEWLYSKDKNQGSAGKVMSEIINAADRTGVTLHLDCGEHWPALPGTKEKNAIPAKELAGWYETFGFTEGGPIKRMIRKPERADWNPIKVRWAESADFEAPRRPPCSHGRQRYFCKECGGGGICEHDRVRSSCKECGGSAICEHDQVRSRCRDCNGGSICEHNRRRSECKDCGGSEICEHGKLKRFCKECGGSQICEHGKQQSYCNECGGSEICEHGRQRHQCQVCSGTGIYVCGHCREIGHNRRTCPNLHESFHAAEGNDEEPPHTRAIAGVSDSVAKFANANDTDDPAYAFGGFVAGFVLLPLVGTLISGWLMSKLKKRNLIPWENDDAEQG